MTPLETRKAQLREYIEARQKATQGEWKSIEFRNSHAVVQTTSYEIFEDGSSCIEDARFVAKAANESALIAKQLLECIETLEEIAKFKNSDFEETIEAENAIEALNKIAGEK